MSGDKAMGNRIINRRKEMGFSREDLSKLLELSVEQTAAIELGKRATSVKSLQKIANILCVTTDYILMGEPAPENFKSDKAKLVRMIEKNLSEEDAGYYLNIYKSLQKMTSHPKPTRQRSVPQN